MSNSAQCYSHNRASGANIRHRRSFHTHTSSQIHSDSIPYRATNITSYYTTTTLASSNSIIKRCMSSSEIRRGTDLLADSLAHGPRRKIVLESYAPSGVDVKGLVHVGDSPEEDDNIGEDKIIHMNGSIVAFPDACFLWNIKKPNEVTLESLSVIRLYDPPVEYLFIGCDKPIDPKELARIKKEFRKTEIVTEQMDIMNAMGTFNILNGEDRRVSCVLVIDTDEE